MNAHRRSGAQTQPGTVYLVGAGPGDPGLLTLRAAELLGRADAVVYDALVNPAILQHCRPDAEMIFAGKRGGRHFKSQDDTNRLLVDLAQAHWCVVRLKGGDPFVFGRGGEEALVLRKAGVAFQIVPGVTAAVAAAAYAGIPVTQRGFASSLTLATGHEDPTKPDTDIDWNHLAAGNGTLAFYMGVGRMAENFRRLIEAGRDEGTPAAVIEWGTYARQRTVVGTLATLPQLAEKAVIGAPALVIVGDVVRLRDDLRWFDASPLSGLCVLVTRARAQASALSTALADLGADVVEFPTIRIAPPQNEAPLNDAARNVDASDWVVFTSANGVDAFSAALGGQGRDARALAGVRICAVGPATSAALRQHGLRADLVPEQYVSEGVLDALSAACELSAQRILLIRAEAARDVLPQGLRERGAVVNDVTAYRTVPDDGDIEQLRQRFAADTIDIVTFTAASTVRNLSALPGVDLGRAAVACIGPMTAAAARDAGMRVDVEAGTHTIDGLVAAVCEWAAARETARVHSSLR